MTARTVFLSALATLLSVAYLHAADPESNTPPNVLLICVDDLRPELGCFGVEYIQSPRIDALAKSGRAFHRHYVQAPTCGASRYTLLTGTYGPSGNHALFSRAKKAKDLPPTLPAYFRQNGYTTVSVGKVSHHPGGRGGKNWDDDAQPEMPLSWTRHLLPAGPWEHPRGSMHGLAFGEIRYNATHMDVIQAEDCADADYPDGLIVAESLRQLDQLATDRKAEATPFFLAVGIIRPHLPFGAPATYLKPYEDATLPPTPHPNAPPKEQGQTTWHRSGEFMRYNRWGRDPNKDAAFALDVRKHYAACVTYADALVGQVLDRLAKHGLTDETIVVLWGDHGWHLGEHAVWGKHTLFEESLRSPLIVRYPGMPKPGAKTDAVVETLDVFPTLADLAGLPAPKDVDGVTLRPNLEDPAAAGHPAVSYKSNTLRTIRTDTHRLIAHPKGQIELYDHRTPDAETKNVAESQPKEAKRLLGLLEERMGSTAATKR